MALPREFYASTGRLNTDRLAIKFFVGFGIIAIFSMICLAFCGTSISNMSGHTHTTAQREAEKFLRLVPNVIAIQCAGTDSDGDGYVSCPYTTKDGVIHPLECAGGITFNSGCRPPKAVFQPIGVDR